KKPPSSRVTPPPCTRTTACSGAVTGLVTVPARCRPSSVRIVTAVLWAGMRLPVIKDGVWVNSVPPGGGLTPAPGRGRRGCPDQLGPVFLPDQGDQNAVASCGR